MKQSKHPALCREDGGSRLTLKFREFLPDYTASLPTRKYPSHIHASYVITYFYVWDYDFVFRKLTVLYCCGRTGLPDRSLVQPSLSAPVSLRHWMEQHIFYSESLTMSRDLSVVIV